ALIIGFLGMACIANGQPSVPKRAQEVEWKSATPQPAPAIIPVAAQIEAPRLPEPQKANESQITITPLADARRPLPINLATAMQLAGTQPIDVQVASRQVGIAAAQYDRARYVWLPSVLGGIDYFRHDGIAQNIPGDLINNSRSTFMAGGSLNAVFG